MYRCSCGRGGFADELSLKAHCGRYSRRDGSDHQPVILQYRSQEVAGFASTQNQRSQDGHVPTAHKQLGEAFPADVHGVDLSLNDVGGDVQIESAVYSCRSTPPNDDLAAAKARVFSTLVSSLSKARLDELLNDMATFRIALPNTVEELHAGLDRERTAAGFRIVDVGQVLGLDTVSVALYIAIMAIVSEL